MKNSNIFLIICLCLIHSKIAIEEDSKEITLYSLLEYECPKVDTEEFIMNFSIEKTGINEKETIKFRLRNPSYAEVECEIPENTNTMKCSLDVKLYPLYDYDLEFPVASTRYNDITINFGKLNIINSIFCSYEYSYKFSLFEEETEYLCSSNQIKLSGNLYQASGSLAYLETSFLADDTLLKDFNKIKLTKLSEKRYSILLSLPKKFNDITFFPTVGKIDYHSTLFDISHYIYNISCPDANSYISIKMIWLFLIILALL